MLQVSPPAISFGTSAVTESITILNVGAGTLTWTAREVARVGDIEDNTWVPTDIEFISIESADGIFTGPDVIQGSATTELDRVNVIADRSGLPPALFTDIGIEISSNVGTFVVPISVRVVPSLSVAPPAVTIGENSVEGSFTIFNSSPGTLDWEIFILADPADPNSRIPVPAFVVDLPLSGSIQPHGAQEVTVTISREGLDSEVFVFNILILSTSGSAVVPVTFGVGGANVFDVDPDAITIPVNVFGSGPNPLSEFTISNPRDEDFIWSLSFAERDFPGVPFLPSFIVITPLSGTLSAGRDQVVQIEVLRSELSRTELANIVITVTAVDVGTATVDLRVIAIDGPRLSIRQEPILRTSGLLDFGTDNEVLILGIGNTGGIGTRLEFILTTDRPDLILLPTPASGTSIGFNCPLIAFFTCFDWVDFPIAIDRSAMDPDAEFDGGEIRIEAVVDDESEALEPIIVAVNIKRTPLRIEGATNRTRPPKILRFVFLLRNSLLRAVDTKDPDVLRSIEFFLTENDLPLDLNETNFFVTGPEELKTNIVLLLDFTGSMFRSDEDEGIPNGQRIQEMVDGAIEFINDVPDSYRVQIMEYHEQNQIDRLIHPFSTDKAAMIASLENFSLSPADHGATELFDALGEAITSLVAQDPIDLPFDDADVRAVIFVSDGNDTSSDSSSSDVSGDAEDGRVRLYPLMFGDTLNLAPLFEMAEASGGHVYQAIGTRTLGGFLGTPGEVGEIWTDLQRQLVLTYIALAEGDGTYRIQVTLPDERTGLLVSADFQRTAFVFDGDPRMGQVSLTTANGIESNGDAEVFIRTDFVPRNITQFRVRLVMSRELRMAHFVPGNVELVTSNAENGLLSGWRIIPENGGIDGVFTVLTEELDPLPFGAFGNLLKVTFEDFAPSDVFELGFRMDNTIYLRGGLDNPVNTKFFVYPSAHTNPTSSPTSTLELRAGRSSIAPAGEDLLALSDESFDPDAFFAFDRDEDGINDFDDPDPDNNEIPQSILVQRLLTFPVGTDTQTFIVRNNRLDRLDWEIDADSVAALPFGLTTNPTSGILEVTGNSFDPSIPEPSEEVEVTVNRGALAPGNYNGVLLVRTNLEPSRPERIVITVAVQ